MFLSFLNLNMDSGEVKKDLRCAYGLHQKMHRYYNMYDKLDNMIIYSLEYDGDGCANRVVVQTNKNPEKLWEQLRKSGYLVEGSGAEAFFVEDVNTDIVSKGSVFGFRGKFNTVKQLCGGKREYKDPVDWIIGKSEHMGCKIVNVVVDKEGKDVLNKPGLKYAPINYAVMSGILKVVDAEKFRNVWENGLGRSKGFGCGLIRVFKLK